MSSKSKKLGTLADIFQSEKLDGTILKIPLHKIKPSQIQPRKDRTMGIEELAESIKREGLLSPIIVTKDGDIYRIIAGERRYHAVNLLGWKEVECKIISREEKDYFRIALVENLQRENLSPEEEVEALLYLKENENLTDNDLAMILGKSRNYISEILSIGQIPKEIIEECKKSGFYNKNYLIQVAQALKKGQIDEFMSSMREGKITSVKEAKNFNKTNVKSHLRNLPNKNSEYIYQIRKEKNLIIIETDNPKLLKKIYDFLEKELNQFINRK